MTLNHPRLLPIMAFAIAVFCLPMFAAGDSPFGSANTTTDAIGTWRGTSTCVGYRPACKNEEVVYRFATVPGKTDLVTLYADKILDGKRVPMYKLDFVYDRGKGTLSAEFTKRQTHGLWQYQLSGDKLEGTLMLLPDKNIGRTVQAHRVTENQVPEAPPLTEYEARAGLDESPIKRA